jgi:hypothetical protein
MTCRGPVAQLQEKSSKSGTPMLSFECHPIKKPMLTLNSIIQRDSDVIAAEADQDLIMVSIASGCYYGLSDVAREIWDAIEQPKRISDLVADLSSSYQIDSFSCEQETLAFLEALRAEGLLRVEDESAG